MGNPRLILLSSDNSEREFRLTGSVSIGRAGDNLVHIGDGTVSLYHAVIEEKRGGGGSSGGGGGGFWLSDLGSVYGTTVNGRPVKAEHHLRDGDLIRIGGAATLRYSEDGTTGGKTGVLARFGLLGGQGTAISPVGMAVVAASVLIVVVIALVLVKLLAGGGDCDDVKIVGLSPGAAISAPVRIQTQARNPQCVKSVSYRIDGRQFARPATNLFEATLDPAALKERFTDLATGDHELSIAVETESGQAEVVVDSLTVRIELADVGAELSLDAIHEMAQRVAARINQRGEIFVFSDEFLKRIRSAAQAYRIDMATDAERLGSEIRLASNKLGIPEQLMFVLAASRSRFREGQGVEGCGVDPNGVGIFKIPRAVMLQFGETAVDPETVAQITARHLRDLIAGQRDDFFYAVACFGESSQRIGEIFQRNDQQARRDFQSLVERGEIRPEEASRVVCFFAAGIVAENPGKFGINAKSLVDVYR